MFGSNDLAHCLKIMAGQLRTAAKTASLGDDAVDGSACLLNGAPLSSYRGDDAQSDRDAALLLCSCCPAEGESLSFAGCGSFMYAFAVTASFTAWYDPHLSMGMRHVLSAFSFYFWHLARQHVFIEAARKGMRPAERSRMFLAPFKAITSCCAHMVSRTFFWDRGASGKSPPGFIVCITILGMDK